MTSNALKSAILLDAMAVIVSDFDKEGDARKTEMRVFTVEYVIHAVDNCHTAGGGEIRVLNDATHIEKFHGASPSFVDALKRLRGEGDEQTWTKDACTSIDRDGDEFITVFASRKSGDALPGLDHGTYAVLGGTGKFKGFSAIGAYTWAITQSSGAELAATFTMEVMHKERRREADFAVSERAYSPIAA